MQMRTRTQFFHLLLLDNVHQLQASNKLCVDMRKKYILQKFAKSKPSRYSNEARITEIFSVTIAIMQNIIYDCRKK